MTSLRATATSTPRAALIAAAALTMIACGPPQLGGPPAPTEPDTGRSDAGPDGMFPDTGIGTSELALTRLAPGHGPFLGGNEVLVRGGGFSETTTVSVGGRFVQAADVQLVDANRLLLLAMPAGEPGPADVVVADELGSASLEGGYVYDAIALDPARGSVSGGTIVTATASGTSFVDGDLLRFGRAACTNVEIVSPTVMRCRTPAGAAGSVDVAYESTAAESQIIPDGYEYYDSSDPSFGGLGGGPLDGSLNVSVYDAFTGLPVSEAFVIVDEDPATEHQGLTNILGQITFSGDDLYDQHTVHVAKNCYEKTSWVAFDAQDVTIFLVPWQDPACGMGSGGGGGAGRAGATVSGELIWSAGLEFETPRPNPWDNVPEPRNEDWLRVAYVYATQPCAGTSPSCTNPDPNLSGAQNRVTESRIGERGYGYSIFVRPAAFAVYSLAGLENRNTGEFVPYVMGIARNVLAGPAQEIDGQDMIMNIPLDHYLDVRVDGLPGRTPSGPNRFEVSADIDLGGEGVIVRNIGGDTLDILSSRTNERSFRFFAQPAIFGALSDGRYRVEASWVTGDFGADPSSNTRLTGIREVDQLVTANGFPPIPVATAPAFGEPIPADRILRWDAEGGVEPDFYYIQMIGGDNNPAWRFFVKGDQRTAPIPNLEDIPGIDDVAGGFVTWFAYAIRIPGFDYDRMTYRDISERRWNAWSVNTFTARQ